MDNISNVYRHYLQQHHQQQQQQQHHHQQQDEYYQYQQHLPSHSLPSLATKNLYGVVQPLEHAPIHYSSSLSHLPSSSLSSASGFPFHQTLPATLLTQISTPPSLRNPNTAEINRHKAPQQAFYQGAAQIARNVENHFSGGGSSASDYMQHAVSLHGLGSLDMQISHKIQQSLDNYLRSGVDPPTTTTPITQSQTLHSHPYVSTHQIFATSPWTVMPPQASLHPFFTTNPRTVMPVEVNSHQVVTANPRTAMPAHMAWPRKRKIEAVEKKTPVIKTTTMKEVGSSKNGAGWCSVCRRDCITEAALKQHFDGKRHKKQVEQQRAIPEEEAKKKAMMDEGGGAEVATVLQQMWVQVSMMGKSAKPKKKKVKANKEPENSAASLSNPAAVTANTTLVDVNATPGNANIILEGDGNAMCAVANALAIDVNAAPCDRNNVLEGDANTTCPVSNAEVMDINVTHSDKNVVPEGDGNAMCSHANDVPMDVNVTPADGNVISEGDGNANPLPTADSNTLNSAREMKKEEVSFRCELCNVACNAQSVLEIHFGGKKHLNKLKKLQEPPATEQTAQ